jgi:hypothetical protein
LINLHVIGENNNAEVDRMYNSIYETVIKGSNTVFLDLPEKEYFAAYDNLSRENVQDLVENYFDFKGRDGNPLVADINVDAITHRIRVTVDVDHNSKTKIESLTTPHHLANWRQHN